MAICLVTSSRMRKNEEFSSQQYIVEQEVVAGGGGGDARDGPPAERNVQLHIGGAASRVMVDAALKESSWRFDAVYASSGRPSIPPEKLLRALLLQMLYTVRSERLLMEQLDYNFLFRWLWGSTSTTRSGTVTVFTKNRERLLVGEVAQGFFNAVGCSLTSI